MPLPVSGVTYSLVLLDRTTLAPRGSQAFEGQIQAEDVQAVLLDGHGGLLFTLERRRSRGDLAALQIEAVREASRRLRDENWTPGGRYALR